MRNAFQLTVVVVVIVCTMIWLRRAKALPSFGWLVSTGVALATVDQPLQQCATRQWVVLLGWTLGWMLFPVSGGFVVLFYRGSRRQRIMAAMALIALIIYGRSVIWAAVRLCNPALPDSN
jgi:hypothetical protein